MMRIAVLVLLLPLAGCASALAASIPSPSGYMCPKLEAYSPAQQRQLAAEIPRDGPETVIQVEDYAKLRKACGS